MSTEPIVCVTEQLVIAPSEPIDIESTTLSSLEEDYQQRLDAIETNVPPEELEYLSNLYCAKFEWAPPILVKALSMAHYNEALTVHKFV
jgi:hypothetical protein